MKTQMFMASIQEVNGEQEYKQDAIIFAKTLANATKKAEKSVRHWYGDDEDSGKEEDGGYYFLGGRVHVSLENVCPITADEFIRRHTL